MNEKILMNKIIGPNLLNYELFKSPGLCPGTGDKGPSPRI
jgi:hypothetical protein